MADLENLIIKVDSELGDLSGIDSAVQALEGLRQFSETAAKGAQSLSTMAKAFTTMNTLSGKKNHYSQIKKDVKDLKQILSDLTMYTGKADSAIEQFRKLGKALHSFDDLGNSLKGLESIVNGVNGMIDALIRLGNVSSTVKKTASDIGTAGKAFDFSQNIKNTDKSLRETEKTLKSFEKVSKSSLLGKNLQSLKEGLVKVAPEITVDTARVDKQAEKVVGAIENSFVDKAKKLLGKGDNSSIREAITSMFGMSDADIKDILSSIAPDNFDKIKEQFNKAYADIRKEIDKSRSDLTAQRKVASNYGGHDKVRALEEQLDLLKNDSQSVSKILQSLDKLNTPQVFEESAVAANDYGKAVDIVANHLDRLADTAKKFQNLGDIFKGMANYDNQSLKRHEQYMYANSKNGQFSELRTSLQRDFISAEEHNSLYETVEGLVDTFIHSHPDRLAAPSPDDIYAAFERLSDGIDHNWIIAFEQAFKFDASKIADEDQDIIANKYFERVNEFVNEYLKISFEDFEAGLLSSPKALKVDDSIFGRVQKTLVEVFSPEYYQSFMGLYSNTVKDTISNFFSSLDKSTVLSPIELAMQLTNQLAEKFGEDLNPSNSQFALENIQEILSVKLSELFGNLEKGMYGQSFRDDFQVGLQGIFREILNDFGYTADEVFKVFSIDDMMKEIDPNYLLQSAQEFAQRIRSKDIELPVPVLAQLDKLSTQLKELESDIARYKRLIYNAQQEIASGELDYEDMVDNDSYIRMWASGLKEAEEKYKAISEEMQRVMTSEYPKESAMTKGMAEDNERLKELLAQKKTLEAKLANLSSAESAIPSEEIGTQELLNAMEEQNRLADELAKVNAEINEIYRSYNAKPAISASSTTEGIAEDNARLQQLLAEREKLEAELAELNAKADATPAEETDFLDFVSGDILTQITEKKQELERINAEIAKIQTPTAETGTATVLQQAAENIEQNVENLEGSNEKLEEVANEHARILNKFFERAPKIKGSNIKDTVQSVEDTSEALEATGEAGDGIDMLERLGNALHAFNGLDDSIKSLGALADGLMRFLDVASLLKDLNESDIAFLDTLGAKLNSFAEDSFKWVNAGELTNGLASLIKVLRSNESINTSPFDIIKTQLQELSGLNLAQVTQTIEAMNAVLNKMNTSAKIAGEGIRDMEDSFRHGDKALYDVRESIEIISEGFNDTLRGIDVDPVIEEFKKFETVADKLNMGDFLKGLALLIEALNNTMGSLNTTPIDNLYDGLKKLANTPDLNDTVEKLQGINQIAYSIGRLLNAIHFSNLNRTAGVDVMRQSFQALKEQLLNVFGMFKDSQFEFEKFTYMLYGYKNAFQALFNTEDIPQDNLFTKLKTILTDPVWEDISNKIKNISNLTYNMVQIADKLKNGERLSTTDNIFTDIGTNLQNLQKRLADFSFSDMSKLFRSIVDLVNAVNTIKLAWDNPLNRLPALLDGLCTSAKKFEGTGFDKILTGLTSLVRVITKLSIFNTNYINERFVAFDSITKSLKAFESVNYRKLEALPNILNNLAKVINAMANGKGITSENDGLMKVVADLMALAVAADDLKNLAPLTSSLTKLVTAVSVDMPEKNGMTTVAQGLADIAKLEAGKEIVSLSNSLTKLATSLKEVKIDANNNIFTQLKEMLTNLNIDKLGGLLSIVSSISKLVDVMKESGKVTLDNKNPLVQMKFLLDMLGDTVPAVKGLPTILKAIGKGVEVMLKSTEGFDMDNNPFALLNEMLSEIGTSNTKLKGLDKVIKSLLNAFETLKLVNGTDFTIDLANNPFTMIKKVLEGFQAVMPDIENLPKVLNALKKFLEVFDAKKQFAIDTKPLADMIEAIANAKGLGDAVTNLKAMLKSLKDAAKLEPTKLDATAMALGHLKEHLADFKAAGKLQSLADIANAMIKMEKIDFDKFVEMATAIRMIVESLGQIQGSNNVIKINLDERGIVQMEDETKKATETWNDFAHRLMEDLKNMNFNDKFSYKGSTKELKEQLREAERGLKHAREEAEKWNQSVKRTIQVQGEEAARNQEKFQRAVSQYYTNAREAQLYEAAVRRLNHELELRNGYELENDAQGYREIQRLRKEYEEILDVLVKYQKNADWNKLEGFDAVGAQSEVFEILEARLEEIDNTIPKILEEIEALGDTAEGNSEKIKMLTDHLKELNDEAEKAKEGMSKAIGENVQNLGDSFKNIPVLKDSELFKGLTDAMSKFGSSLSSGKINLPLNKEQLEGLGKFTASVSKVVGSIGMVLSYFKKLYDDIGKLQTLMTNFVKSMVSFSKAMLSKVVGAFNAVAGAVSKVVSAVRSGAEGISVALRKIGDFGKGVVSIFSKIGGAFAPALKGIKAMLSLVTPRIAKTLASTSLSLKNIIKQSHALTKIVKTFTRWFSMLSRMLMRRSVTAFINQMKQAFEDLAMFEYKSGDAMLQFNTNISNIFSGIRRAANQWMAAFEPLINAVTPMVLNFLNNVQAMGENVAKFMAILTGQPYYLRAKKFFDNYAEGLETANKKAKELTNGLDELNVLNDNKDDEDDWNKYFETEKVPVDGELFDFSGLGEIVDKIIDFLQNIDWQKIWDKIREIIHTIMEYLNYLLSRIDLWKELGTLLGNLFNSLMVAWNQFITDFDPTALEKAISALIVNALKAIDWDLIHENIELTAQKFAQFWNDVFADDELWNEIAKAITNILNEIVHYFDTFAWNFDFAQMAQQLTDKITQILQNFDYEKLRHAVEGWATGIKDFINTTIANKELWKTLGSSLANIINSTLIEALKDLAGIDLTDFSNSLKTAIQNALDGIHWDDFTQALQDWASNFAGFINDFFGDSEFLSKITSNIGNFGNAIIGAISKFINDIKGYDIGKALGDALGSFEIDWDTLFKLPADILNKLSEAIKGLLDSIPEDFNLGTWLAEHLNITMEGIDWDTISQNIETTAQNIVDYINGLISAPNFWENLGLTTGKVLDLLWKITVKPLADVNFNDLVESIKTALSKALSGFNITEKLGDLGVLTQKIIEAVDQALAKTNWKEIGRQIGDGISAFLDKINPSTIAQTIYDAFIALSGAIGGTLEVMIKNKDFEKLGLIIANAFYGALAGLADFITNNKDKLTAAMTQMATTITKFLKKHEKEIVKMLNDVIHGFGDIITGYLKNKSGLIDELVRILKQTDLGDLLGTILAMAITKWIESVKIKGSILTSIISSFGSLVKRILESIPIKDLIMEIGKKLVAWLSGKLLINLLKFLATKAGAAWLGTALGGPIGAVIGLVLGTIIEAIADKLGAFDWLEDKISSLFDKAFGGKDKTEDVDLEDELQKKLDDALSGIELNAEIDVDTKYNFDEEGFNWEDYLNKQGEGTVILDDPKFGKITCEQIEVETLKFDKLELEEIYADVLYVGEIFADILHVGEIDGDMSDSFYNKMDKYWGANDLGAQGGELSKEDEDIHGKNLYVDDIFAKSLNVEDLKGLLDDFLEALKVLLDKYLSDYQEMLDEFIETYTKVLDDFVSDHKKMLDKFHKSLKKTLDEFIKALTKAIQDIDWEDLGKRLADGFLEEYFAKLEEQEGFADMFLSEEDKDAVIERIEDIFERVIQCLAELQLTIDAYGGDLGSMLFDNEDGINLSKRMERALIGVKQFLKDVYDAFVKFKEDLEKIIDDIDENFLSKLKENVEKELAETLEVIEEYVELINKAFEDFNEEALTLFEGLDDSAEEELKKVLDIVKKYMSEMDKEFDDFKDGLGSIFGDISDNADDEFTHIYEVVDNYLDKIQRRIDEFKNNLDQLFNDFVGDAQEQFEKLLEVVNTYIDKIEKAIDSLEEAFTDLAENVKKAITEAVEACKTVKDIVDELIEELGGLADAILDGIDIGIDDFDKEFQALYDLIDGWIDKINNLLLTDVEWDWSLDKFHERFEEEFSACYDSAEEWLDKIKELFNDYFEDVDLGLDVAIGEALDDSYGDAEEWVEKVRNLLQDVFDDFTELEISAEVLKLKRLEVDEAAFDTITSNYIHFDRMDVTDAYYDNVYIDFISGKTMEIDGGIKAKNLTVDFVGARNMYVQKLEAELYELNKHVTNLSDRIVQRGKDIGDNTDALNRLTRVIREGGCNCVCNCDTSGLADAIGKQTEKIGEYIRTGFSGGYGNRYIALGDGGNYSVYDPNFTKNFMDSLDSHLNDVVYKMKEALANITCTCNCNCGGDCDKCSFNGGNIGTLIVNGDLNVNGNLNANGGINISGGAVVNGGAVINGGANITGGVSGDGGTDDGGDNPRDDKGGYNPPIDKNDDTDDKKDKTPEYNPPTDVNDISYPDEDIYKPDINLATGDGAEGGSLDKNKEEEEKKDLAVQVPNGDLMTYAEVKDEKGNVIGTGDDVTSEAEAERYGVLDKFLANRDEANRRVEEWRNEAKSYYDNIMANGTESEKARAQSNYDLLMANRNQFGQDSYKNALNALKYYSDSVDSRQNPELFAEKAKQIYDEIMNNPNASDYQKNMAAMNYNNVLLRTNKDSSMYNPEGAASFYKNLVTMRDEIGSASAEDKIKSKGIRIGMNDKVAQYYSPNGSNQIGNATRQALATAILYGKDLKGKSVSWFLGSGSSNANEAVKDEATINEIKNFLKSFYGITEADLPKGYVDKYINKNSGTSKDSSVVPTNTADGNKVAEQTGSSVVPLTTASDSKEAEQSSASVVPLVSGNQTAEATASSETGENKDVDISDIQGSIDSNKSDTVKVSAKGAGTLGVSSLYDQSSESYQSKKNRINDIYNNGLEVTGFSVGGKKAANAQAAFEYWYKNSFLVKGYQMGGLPSSGELFISRENGTPEFVGSFGNRTAVANNDQIVSAVANGVSMANDRLASAIQSQTNDIVDAINRKDIDVTIGDRQIAEANRRGQQSLGNNFID